MSPHLSTLTLHRLRLGELQGDALSAAKTHLDGCEVCRGRAGHQLREREAFVLRPVPQAIRDVSARPALPWWREWLPLGLAFAAAAAVFVAVPAIRGPDAPQIDTIRFRGELPTIEVWVDRGGPRALRDGERVRAGERIQLGYDPRGASSIALAGRDGTGRIEVWTTNAPTGIGLVRAPFALTLDDAPGPQELFVVGSDRPLDEAAVKAALGGGVPGVRVARVALPKEP